jgi:hypothetical protein
MPPKPTTTSTSAAAAQQSVAQPSARERRSSPTQSFKNASGGGTSGGNSPTYRSSLAKLNNSWYQGEDGEHSRVLRTGSIVPEKDRKLPATERQDNFTRLRDLANDGKRYSYVRECTNSYQRDYTLRFSHPPQATKAPDTFSLLPPLRYAEKTSGSSKHGGGPMRASVGSTASLSQRPGGAINATAMQARQTRVAGVAEPSRFSVVVSPQPR